MVTVTISADTPEEAVTTARMLLEPSHVFASAEDAHQAMKDSPTTESDEPAWWTNHRRIMAEGMKNLKPLSELTTRGSDEACSS